MEVFVENDEGSEEEMMKRVDAVLGTVDLTINFRDLVKASAEACAVAHAIGQDTPEGAMSVLMIIIQDRYINEEVVADA